MEEDDNVVETDLLIINTHAENKIEIYTREPLGEAFDKELLELIKKHQKKNS